MIFTLPLEDRIARAATTVKAATFNPLDAWMIVNGHTESQPMRWAPASPRPNPFRGWFLIHAHANRPPEQTYEKMRRMRGGFILPPSYGLLDAGGIVGIAELVDVRTEKGSGIYQWILRNAAPLPFQASPIGTTIFSATYKTP